MLATADLRQAAAADWPRIEALLQAAQLPSSDLSPAVARDFILADEHGTVIGAVALERHGAAALLRSLVVDRAWRGRGLGRALVDAAETRARAAGIDSLTLLTQSAAGFFRQLGYSEVPRERAPQAVQSSTQFTQLCPASSTCMTKSLTPSHRTDHDS